jgi:hypothetical protein
MKRRIAAIGTLQERKKNDMDPIANPVRIYSSDPEIQKKLN